MDPIEKVLLVEAGNNELIGVLVAQAVQGLEDAGYDWEIIGTQNFPYGLTAAQIKEFLCNEYLTLPALEASMARALEVANYDHEQ